jgi:diguanylate cyclase (GGDEF)-like protein/PAS domain S-box-containing protein
VSKQERQTTGSAIEKAIGGSVSSEELSDFVLAATPTQALPMNGTGESRDLALRSASPHDRNKPLHILFVHSGSLEVQRCLKELDHAHARVMADLVSTPNQFAERLSSKSYDAVLAEYPLPDWQGAATLDLLRQKNTQAPLIFLADAIPQETVAELLSNGAADCIEMRHIGHLPVVLRRVLHANNLREERDHAERQLQRSEAHYRALVGNLVYGMCRCNPEGTLLNVNQTLMIMLGYTSKEELLGVRLLDEILGNHQKRLRMLRQADNGTPAPLEVDWKQKNGASLKVRLSGREAEDEQGQMDGYEIIVEDITKQRELEDHLRQLAAKDGLTGLANYRTLVEVLDSEMRRSQRTGREFAVVLFDLDGLKRINDRYGHLTGNEALRRLADTLSICCRDIDTAARFGGDEFALVLPETTAPSAGLVAQRIRESLALDGRGIKLSVSTGAAAYPQDGQSIGELLGAADAAMYAMKDRQLNSAAKIAMDGHD